MGEEYKAEAHQLPAGTILKDRYEIKRVIGEGGFGITYEGFDTTLKARIAVKEYYMTGFVNRNNEVSLDVIPSVGEKAEVFRKNLEKFYSEATVLAQFGDEDGIVHIHDYFQENATAYIVMEYLDGGSLKDFLQKRGPLYWEDTIDLLMPGMISLERVHKAGIIHRDISPDNIMLTKNGRVRILDFGAARKVDGGDPKSLSVILKPGYAPEEQYRSKGIQGPWTDVYAFCATMYRCITGVVPDESMDRLVSDTLRPVHVLVPDCPVSVSKVIEKGMAVNQKDRYQTMADLVDALEWARRNPGAVELPAELEKEPLVPADVQGDPYAELQEIFSTEACPQDIVPDMNTLIEYGSHETRYGGADRITTAYREEARSRSMYGESSSQYRGGRSTGSQGRSRYDGAGAPGRSPYSGAGIPGRSRYDGAGSQGGSRYDGADSQGGSRYDEAGSLLPGSPGVAALDPNATVYAGRVETYEDYKENKEEPEKLELDPEMDQKPEVVSRAEDVRSMPEIVYESEIAEGTAGAAGAAGGAVGGAGEAAGAVGGAGEAAGAVGGAGEAAAGAEPRTASEAGTEPRTASEAGAEPRTASETGAEAKPASASESLQEEVESGIGGLFSTLKKMFS